MISWNQVKKKLNIFADLVDDNTENSNLCFNAFEKPSETESLNHFSIFKIPKYLEISVNISMLMMFNSIIFNMIVLPIKFLILLVKKLFNRNVADHYLKVYFLKIIIVVVGITFKSFIENSYPMFAIHHKLRSTSSIKIFTFFKIIQVVNGLCSKFIVDFDIQLIHLMKNQKYYRWGYLLIIIMFLLIQVAFMFTYISAISVVLNDSKDYLYLLCLKINYYDMKKHSKIQKKKNLMSRIIYKDIYDRFVLIFSILIVVYQNFQTNKLNANNFLIYLKRIGFLVIADVMFDWIKIVLIYKYSGFEAKTLKIASFEIALFHEKLRHNSFNSNGNRAFKNTYSMTLEKIELDMVGKDKAQYWKYNNILDFDVITCMELENNVIIYCVFFLAILKDDFGLKLFEDIRFYMTIIILLVFQRIVRLIIKNFVLSGILKEDEKLSTKSVISPKKSPLFKVFFGD